MYGGQEGQETKDRVLYEFSLWALKSSKMKAVLNRVEKTPMNHLQ